MANTRKTYHKYTNHAITRENQKKHIRKSPGESKKAIEKHRKHEAKTYEKHAKTREEHAKTCTSMETTKYPPRNHLCTRKPAGFPESPFSLPKFKRFCAQVISVMGAGNKRDGQKAAQLISVMASFRAGNKRDEVKLY